MIRLFSSLPDIMDDAWDEVVPRRKVQLGVGERREAEGGRGLLMYERTLGDSHSGRSAAHDASLVTQRRVSGVTRIGEDKTSQTLITSARGAWPKPPCPCVGRASR
jgi:hypothetical protein